MAEWLLPLTASVVALVVGIGVEQFQWTGRTRRRLAADLALVEKLDAEAKHILSEHVAKRVRLLVAAEEPFRDLERRLQRHGRWMLFGGFVGLADGYVLFKGYVESFWLWAISTGLFVSVMMSGVIYLWVARAGRKDRVREKYRQAVPEPPPLPLPVVAYESAVERYRSSEFLSLYRWRRRG